MGSRCQPFLPWVPITHLQKGSRLPPPFPQKAPQTHQVLEDEGEGALCVDDVVQGDDVGMFQVLQQ